jgi:hypothetical protein
MKKPADVTVDVTSFSDPIPDDAQGLSDAQCCDAHPPTSDLLVCSRVDRHDGPHIAIAVYPSLYARIAEVWL